MPRTIVTSRDVNAGQAATQDSFSARLVKYIPAEIVALYATGRPENKTRNLG
jgi:hypothetical protein